MTTVIIENQVDCDSHIQELGSTWELYLAEEFGDRRPAVVSNPHVSNRPYLDKSWYIDGRLVPKNQGNGAVVMSTPSDMSFASTKPVPVDVQACTNPVARAEFMRVAGVHKSVMYSTLFLEVLTDDLVYEAALMRSWNSWMSAMCKQAPENLFFGAVVPLRAPHLAIEEMKIAKKLGAVSVMVLPTAGNRHLHDRYFDPFWAEAEAMQMPVGVHIGWPNPDTTSECTTPSSIFLGAFELSMWWGYLSVFAGGILDRFPKLKVAFFEHDAKWFELFAARARHWQPTTAAAPWTAQRSVAEYLQESDVYFSFDGDFSYLPRFMEIVGADRVMGALDFPHTHYGTSNLSAAFEFIRNHEALNDTAKQKLLRDNAVAFYSFDRGD